MNLLDNWKCPFCNVELPNPIDFSYNRVRLFCVKCGWKEV